MGSAKPRRTESVLSPRHYGTKNLKKRSNYFAQRYKGPRKVANFGLCKE